jgi:hypothetical protein
MRFFSGYVLAGAFVASLIAWMPAGMHAMSGGKDMGKRTEKDVPNANSATITGILTDEGVECPAMRLDDGRLVTLMGDLRGFKAGQRVRIEASRMHKSYCQQGVTMRIHTISAAPEK